MTRKKRSVKDYLKPVHKDDCDLRRDQLLGASALASHVMDQVLGPMRCTCGLQEALDEGVVF